MGVASSCRRCPQGVWTVGTSHCSQKQPFARPDTSAVRHTGSCNSETDLLHDHCEPTGNTQIVTRHTAVTCFAQPPVIQWPVRRSRHTQGETFQALKHSRALRWFLWARDVSSIPDQYSCSGSQSNGLTHHIIWGWPEIHSWPGRLILITLESWLEDGCVGSFLEQEKWSLPQEWDPAVQAAPMVDYACPMCWLPAHTHVRRLQVLQSKCLRLLTGAPWYIGSRQIHEDLWVPFFAEHIRAGTTKFLLKLSRLWGTP
jgi:hypothetical protein